MGEIYRSIPEYRFEKSRDFEVVDLKFSDDDVFYVENELLATCMGFVNQDKDARGFNHGKSNLHYIILVHLVDIALGVRRLPFCEDRISATIQDRMITPAEYDVVLARLTNETLNEAAIELRSLYEHTQRILARYELQTIHLRREISYNEIPSRISPDQGDREQGYELLYLKRLAEIAHRETIKIDMDILNSHGDEDKYKYKGATLEVSVPAGNILYCSKLVDTNIPHFNGRLIETGEWVVLNPSPTGVVEVDIDCISTNKEFIAEKDLSKITTEEALRRLQDRLPYKFRSRWRPTNEDKRAKYMGPSDAVKVSDYLLGEENSWKKRVLVKFGKWLIG